MFFKRHLQKKFWRVHRQSNLVLFKKKLKLKPDGTSKIFGIEKVPNVIYLYKCPKIYELFSRVKNALEKYYFFVL